ncbi:glycosyltransferase family 2 protein [Novosphingobium album (ex Hu et al. 2023)]|uniref:Glycosyltransferase family 2 protein n=1 Tax=Novosphingobium album (ex Hu et al. 2023) TaxID=2930093 RepID=A0ABT0B478_9SPHN|nr:glycosyltransferase family 2 protein [Novosphingobium album (ex Hu et al. 2023)]MCJ2179788.1 glycosyltransferase family 2 protein [Novosphingobium album (ex Hu et al. 2023)]
MSDGPSVAVVIASLGRPDLIKDIIARMELQTRKPDILLFSTVTPQDLPEDFVDSTTVKAIFGPKGLTRQRNAALDYLGGRYDIVLFYDDDFIPSRFSIQNVALFFHGHPEVAGATGHVLVDGINTSGIGKEEGERIVAHYDRDQEFSDVVEAELVGLYGCNMAYRMSAIGSTRFDERLRLYAWQEDIDFAMALQPRGKIVKTRAFAGVHQGLKHGRTPGLRLGYSQVINPLYLAAKGTMPIGFALKLITKNLLANHLKMLAPEPWVDRKGRARGNWAGLWDVFRGRLTPEKIEDL